MIHLGLTVDNCYAGDTCENIKRTIDLTLDDILYNEIRQSTSLSDQSVIIKTSASLTIVMFVAGLINGIFSCITFQNKQLRNVGCGIYLLASSITSLITISMFQIKFWFLFFTQINTHTNTSILLIGCKLIEPLLKFCLYLDAWFNACVAMERAVNVSKGVTFDKAKSRHIARWIIVILPLCVLISLVQEPIKRDMFEVKQYESQTIIHEKVNYAYCATRYSTALKIYNTVIYFFHLLVPFGINLFSALYIIFGNARRRSVAQPDRTYQQHVREQFNEHKQLLISPVALAIVSSPRVIISLVPGCINTNENRWIYLSAYFISFIPAMLIFIIFVLPSDLYKEKFRESMKKWRQCYR